MSQVRLWPQQILAAQAIYEQRAPVWRRSDDALDTLASAMRNNDFSGVLVKTITIDSLYATRVRAKDLQQVAQHVHRTLANTDQEEYRPQLIEELAAVPLRDDTTRHYRSFASKFAHFFVDHRYPILDSYVVDALRDILGHQDLKLEPHYPDFEKAFRKFASGMPSDTRLIDRYLWIVGQYLKHEKDDTFIPNAEIRQVFDDRPPELVTLISEMRSV